MTENTRHHTGSREAAAEHQHNDGQNSAQHSDQKMNQHAMDQHQTLDYQHHEDHNEHVMHEDHSGHQDHTGHEEMFRRRFWVTLALSIPVLIFSPAIQNFFGYSTPDFPGSQLIVPVLGVVIFVYGGLPFLQMAVPEVKSRSPGMMTLISLAIAVAFFLQHRRHYLRPGRAILLGAGDSD